MRAKYNIRIEMNKYQILALKGLRKIYTSVFSFEKNKKLKSIYDADISSQIIYESLSLDEPCMIARFGATELMCIVNYLGVKRQKTNFISYIRGKELDWWWRESSLNQIEQWSGFFPATIPNVEKFCEMMIADSKQVDILGSWLADESYLETEINNAKLIQVVFLEPFWSKIPWTIALKNKNVLVIHPFEDEIRSQYKRRELLFENSNILPEFNLFTIRAVQSLGGDCQFTSWFEALDYMKSEIDKVDFDFCLIGAGAYGFPLAAYVKSIGKKAIHMGGSLQLLFGIKGKRWENALQGSQELGGEGKYSGLMNDYWIYPNEKSKPKNADVVEGACYW